LIVSQSRILRLREPLGERSFDAAQLPLTIGGAGSAIVVPGVLPGAVAAVIGEHAGRLFLQPQGRADSTTTVQESEWIAPGARYRFGEALLQVLPGDPLLLDLFHEADNRTLPPESLPQEGLAESGANLAVPRIEFRAKGEAADSTGTQREQRRSRWILFAVFASLLLLAVLAMQGVSVSVVTEPRVARVNFTGDGSGFSLAGRHWLWPGRYELTVESPGYSPYRTRVSVSDRDRSDFHVALAALPGRVQLVNLPAGSVASWDGVPLPAPHAVRELSAGPHRIEVIAPGFDSYRGTVKVRGLGQNQSVQIPLVPRWAQVSIASDPAGASVKVDGQLRGATPLTLRLDAGLRNLAIERVGQKAWKGQILVKSGVAQSVGPVKLGVADAVLRVSSNPPQADVTVGGQYRGRTPLTVSVPPGIEYDVSVQRIGFEPALAKADFRASASTAIALTLKPIYGELTIRGTPADAAIRIDGHEAAAGKTLRLPAAPVQIEVSKQGYDPFRAAVTLKHGLAQIVDYELVPSGKAAVHKLLASQKNSLGIEMHLMPTGEFVMGSNRREPGRRANEIERRVRLVRAFYMSVKEITNGQFRAFHESHNSSIFAGKTLDLDNQPVVNLSWEEAAEFCNWLSQKDGLPAAYVKGSSGWALTTPRNTGYRLPTEAEWEFTARFEAGTATRRYPWGASLPVPAGSGNFADASAKAVLDSVLDGYEDGYPVTAPPGKYPANALGLYDMGGNVAEWTSDIYTAAPSLDAAVLEDPVGPGDGRQHVVRGSSFKSLSITDLRLSARDGASEGRPDIGFRVARYALEN
jgi:formylglycine-generating enzyme required for sulfatase activity